MSLVFQSIPFTPHLNIPQSTVLPILPTMFPKGDSIPSKVAGGKWLLQTLMIYIGYLYICKVKMEFLHWTFWASYKQLGLQYLVTFCLCRLHMQCAKSLIAKVGHFIAGQTWLCVHTTGMSPVFILWRWQLVAPQLEAADAPSRAACSPLEVVSLLCMCLDWHNKPNVNTDRCCRLCRGLLM